MPDDPPSHRLQALRRGMIVYAVLQVILVGTALAAGDRPLAGVVAMFGVAMGVAVADAVRSRSSWHGTGVRSGSCPTTQTAPSRLRALVGPR